MLEASVNHPTRRIALLTTVPLLGAAGFPVVAAEHWFPGAAPWKRFGVEVSVVEFSDSGARVGLTQVPKVIRSESDWWGRLTPQQYYVTRKHSTDMPFTGTYYRLHEHGLFRCVCCENALFSSEAKYDSGTGWPSFWEPIANENVRTVDLAGVSRQEALRIGIEVLCKRCDAHLGHIFDDGPPPTNLRYCINESALRFVRLNAFSGGSG